MLQRDFGAVCLHPVDEIVSCLFASVCAFTICAAIMAYHMYSLTVISNIVQLNATKTQGSCSAGVHAIAHRSAGVQRSAGDRVPPPPPR